MHFFIWIQRESPILAVLVRLQSGEICDYIKDNKYQSKSHKPLIFIFWCISLQSVTRKRQTRLLDWQSTRFKQNLWSHKYVYYFWTSLSRDCVNKRAVALINSTATSDMNGIHHWNKILRVLKIAVLICVAGAPKLVILLRKLISTPPNGHLVA